MKPVKIENLKMIDFGAPVGWDKEKNGECVTLPIHVTADCLTSYWKPTGEEMYALRQGQPIAIRIFGNTHPVVSVGVLEPAEEDDRLVKLSPRLTDTDIDSYIAKFTDGNGTIDVYSLLRKVGADSYVKARGMDSPYIKTFNQISYAIDHGDTQIFNECIFRLHETFIKTKKAL